MNENAMRNVAFCSSEINAVVLLNFFFNISLHVTQYNNFNTPSKFCINDNGLLNFDIQDVNFISIYVNECIYCLTVDVIKKKIILQSGLTF